MRRNKRLCVPNRLTGAKENATGRRRNRCHSVLFVFPHPDDEVSCAGLVAAFAAAGCAVRAVVITSGGHNGDPNARELESLHALRILGVPRGHVHFARFTDTRIPACRETVRCLEQFRRDDLLAAFLPAPGDDHLDHQAVTAAGRSALRHVPNIFFYPTPSTQPGFAPDTFVDITAFLPKKKRAARCHRSQAAKEYLQPEYLEAQARYWAFGHNMRFAEAFRVCHQRLSLPGKGPAGQS